MIRPSALRLVRDADDGDRIDARDATRGGTRGGTSYQPFAGYASPLVEEALDRIVASRTFARSQRHRRFLRHVVDAALAGRHEELKEVVIGLEVFDREIAGYDPRRDPIVRVEAGRVREKLARYYAGEGAADAFEIQIPIGGYLPQLSRRQPAPATTRQVASLAVLPFASLSTAADDAAFCVALADQLIDLLSRVPGLRVVGRVSASKARDGARDLKAVGKLLGVTTVLEGSVQRVGSRYRCIAQLHRTRDRACVWSRRFDCDIAIDGDLFAFQDRIGDAVLAAVVSPADAQPVARPPSSGIAEARELFERGRYLEQQRTMEGWRKAIALFRRAIAADPTHASAHTHLGACIGQLATMQWEPTLPTMREVERHARRALELDPNDGDAHALIASGIFRVLHDWKRAEPMYREALRVSPNSTIARTLYAGGLVFNGRYVEAIEHGRIALDLDPLNVALRSNFALICAYARDFTTSVAEFEAVLDFDADHLFAHVMLGMTYLWSGRDEPAMTHFRHATSVAPDFSTAYFCEIMAHGYRGEKAEGRRLLDALVLRLEHVPHAQFNRAMAEAYLGDADGMMRTLQRVLDAREVLFVSLPADPSFDPYRDDPRFVALLDANGLPRLPRSPFLPPP